MLRDAALAVDWRLEVLLTHSLTHWREPKKTRFGNQDERIAAIRLRESRRHIHQHTSRRNRRRAGSEARAKWVSKLRHWLGARQTEPPTLRSAHFGASPSSESSISHLTTEDASRSKPCSHLATLHSFGSAPRMYPKGKRYCAVTTTNLLYSYSSLPSRSLGSRVSKPPILEASTRLQVDFRCAPGRLAEMGH